MPDKPLSWVPHENILRYEEMFLFVKEAIDMGVKKVRITGGEPTTRTNLDVFVKMIADYAPEIDLAMTTNGYLMGDLAARLKAAGLKRVNISLDSLRRETAGKFANRDVLAQVLAGIEASIAAGLIVKINTVPIKRMNEGELGAILDWCLARGVVVRFIEFMENARANRHIVGMRKAEILAEIAKTRRFEPIGGAAIGGAASSPALYYAIEGGGEFGLIEPHSDKFCEGCNRIRLSAEGLLSPCLYFDEAKSIRDRVRNGDIRGAVAVLREVLANKREKNRWNDAEFSESNRAFYETGG
jgi:cyclic pyranopterin phosphate synthase